MSCLSDCKQIIAESFDLSDTTCKKIVAESLDLSDTTRKKIIAEYIWIAGSDIIQSVAWTLDGVVSDPQNLPKLNYNRSATGQAPGKYCEVVLCPQAIFKDPFRGGDNIIVLCGAYTLDGDPIPTNNRYKAAKILSHPHVVAEEPRYHIKQQFILLEKHSKWPVGWPFGCFPGPEVPYYCGYDKELVNEILDKYNKACVHAGIYLTGINENAIPNQRITERVGVDISVDPNPLPGDWNCAAGEISFSFSTKSMRNYGGSKVIKKAIKKLKLRKNEHNAACGEGNESLLTGSHETPDINTSWLDWRRMVACLLELVGIQKAGYLTGIGHRSDMDPYVAMAMIAETIILWKP